jgi:hypothetical protein
MRSLVMTLVFVLVACGGSGSDDDGSSSGDGDTGAAEEGCDPSCEATIHFVGNIGIPADITHFTYSMCGGDCVELDIEVPDAETMQSDGEDPAVTVTVTRTNEGFHEDLQGVFAFEGTWTSTEIRLEEGDYVGVSTTRPDGGNIATTARTLDPEETLGQCGCPTIEMDI